MDPQIIDESAHVFPVADGVWGKRDALVNFYIIKDRESGNWALVDAGMKWSAKKIFAMAAALFGEASEPTAILLTHGHFDHAGALPALLERWHVPVYAHELELPFITGMSSYPPPDSSVGGGMMSAISFMYPTSPIDISRFAKKLPGQGFIPGFPEWTYVETPGHSPGHISLFRQHDKVLIAGDALMTTKAESVFYALTFREHLSGPPKYFTCDWTAARLSLLKLMTLEPEIIAAGHGKPMHGEGMRAELEALAEQFKTLAAPKHGRYAQQPAVTNKFGVASVPVSHEKIPLVMKVLGLAAIILTTSFVSSLIRKKR